jgi:hypothetical protein
VPKDHKIEVSRVSEVSEDLTILEKAVSKEFVWDFKGFETPEVLEKVSL